MELQHFPMNADFTTLWSSNGIPKFWGGLGGLVVKAVMVTQSKKL